MTSHNPSTEPADIAKTVEILDPHGNITNRRTVDHVDVWQALRIPGWAVRAPSTFRAKSLNDFPFVPGRSHLIVLENNTVTVHADEATERIPR